MNVYSKQVGLQPGDREQTEGERERGRGEGEGEEEGKGEGGTYISSQ